VGLIFYGLLFTNSLAHIVPMLLGRGYNPGALSASILFLPLSWWLAHACFGAGRISYRGLPVLAGAGVIGHVVLMGTVLSFIHGVIGSTALVTFQILNAILFLLIPWIAERLMRLGPSTGRPVFR